MEEKKSLSEWFSSTCGGIICMYIGGPETGKQLVLRDDPRYKQVLRVLEAAGKVDKSKALDGLEALRAMMSRELFMNAGPTFGSVRALLAALPDKEPR